MIQVTSNAINKVRDLLVDENLPNAFLRMFVQGGGCSGYQYGFTFDEDQTAEDVVIERGTVKVLIDAMSMQYLQGAEIDYVEELMGASFSIKNPNAQSSCSCGSSFSCGS